MQGLRDQSLFIGGGRQRRTLLGGKGLVIRLRRLVGLEADGGVQLLLNDGVMDIGARLCC